MSGQDTPGPVWWTTDPAAAHAAAKVGVVYGDETRSIVDRMAVIPVEKMREQQADFLKRADWARSHGTLEAASIWVSAANLLQYLLPEEPTS